MWVIAIARCAAIVAGGGNVEDGDEYRQLGDWTAVPAPKPCDAGGRRARRDLADRETPLEVTASAMTGAAVGSSCSGSGVRSDAFPSPDISSVTKTGSTHLISLAPAAVEASAGETAAAKNFDRAAAGAAPLP
jgi:hypothetical protein